MDFGDTISRERAGWASTRESTPSAAQAAQAAQATPATPAAAQATPAPVPAPSAVPAPVPAAASGVDAMGDMPSESSPVMEPIETSASEAAEQITREQLIIASSDHLARESDAPEPVFGEPIEVEEEPVEKGISVITREATVLGDIITEGHIDIVGRVKGNIDAKGDVAIHGIVRGDVDGSKIGLYSCRVKGNLNAGLGVIVDDSSIIGGDVKTKNIIFDGKVKGNIDADNVVVLRSHSYCLGDVSAASLAVEPGAILNGKVRTFVDGDLEAPFDEVM
jgi:cytoskeletal protein CcmA (bactofilin family)